MRLRSFGRAAGAVVAMTDAVSPLFRATLTGGSSSMRDAFRIIRSENLPGEYIIDPPHHIMGARLPVSADGSEGYWDLCADGPVDRPDLFTVVTCANYATVREEAVVPEGLFEIHLLIEGPAALDTAGSEDDAPERRFEQTSLILCQAGAKTGYLILCPAGPRKLVSLYIEPRALIDLFGLSVDTLGPLARELLQPVQAKVSIAAIPARLPMLAAVKSLTEHRPFDRGRLQMIRAKSLEILCHVVDELKAIDSPPFAVTLVSSDIEMLERARAILKRDIENPPTIASLARTVGTNTDKLKRGFKLLFGMTVFEYGLYCRMAEAQRLLSQGLPVKSVAMAIGYRHQASFATAFHNYFGFSPSFISKGGSRETVTGRPVEFS
jgi:AraC-like DNA-binding protein